MSETSPKRQIPFWLTLSVMANLLDGWPALCCEAIRAGQRPRACGVNARPCLKGPAAKTACWFAA